MSTGLARVPSCNTGMAQLGGGKSANAPLLPHAPPAPSGLLAQGVRHPRGRPHSHRHRRRAGGACHSCAGPASLLAVELELQYGQSGWLTQLPSLDCVSALHCPAPPRPQLLPIDRSTPIAAMVPVSEFQGDAYLVLLTRSGLIKRTPLVQFGRMTAAGKMAVKLRVRGCRNLCLHHPNTQPCLPAAALCGHTEHELPWLSNHRLWQLCASSGVAYVFT